MRLLRSTTFWILRAALWLPSDEGQLICYNIYGMKMYKLVIDDGKKKRVRVSFLMVIFRFSAI